MFLDTGSTPVYSIKTEQVELCIGYYRIQKSVLFGVLKKIKVTALYVAKVIYNVVISFIITKNVGVTNTKYNSLPQHLF